MNGLLRTLPCPGLWYGPGDDEEHMCVLLFGHDGDCLCGSCGEFRAESEDTGEVTP